MNLTWKKAILFAREALIIGLIIILASFASKPINSWFGKRAIDDVNLEDVAYSLALQRSVDEGKPLMLEFSATWCSSCRKFDRKVMANVEVNEKIRSEYIFARLDYDEPEDRQIFDQYGVQGFPLIIVIDPDSSNAKKLAFTFDPENFLQQLSI